MFVRVLFAVLFATQVAACGLYAGPGVPDIHDTAGGDAVGTEGSSSDTSGEGVVHFEN